MENIFFTTKFYVDAAIEVINEDWEYLVLRQANYVLYDGHDIMDCLSLENKHFTLKSFARNILFLPNRHI